MYVRTKLYKIIFFNSKFYEIFYNEIHRGLQKLVENGNIFRSNSPKERDNNSEV